MMIVLLILGILLLWINFFMGFVVFYYKFDKCSTSVYWWTFILGFFALIYYICHI